MRHASSGHLQPGPGSPKLDLSEQLDSVNGPEAVSSRVLKWLHLELKDIAAVDH